MVGDEYITFNEALPFHGTSVACNAWRTKKFPSGADFLLCQIDLLNFVEDPVFIYSEHLEKHCKDISMGISEELL